jgi:O-methyltransferase involved in polyketide biosynthesis
MKTKSKNRPIRNISDTALWVAYYRSMESEREDALFNDPYAKQLAGERGKEIVENLPFGEKNAWGMIVRMVIIDEYIM